MTEIETEPKEQENTNLKHDGLFKKTMENPLAAQEFLDYYLPTEVKEIVDLSKLKPEKETFVEEYLKRRMSDVVYSAPTKDNEKAFIYCLIEHQSSNDNLLILRMWKYMLLLCERHMVGNKLPLIVPIVLYNGTAPYTASRNLWQLFPNPSLAKKLLTEDYTLIDLQSMSDDEIIHKQSLGMLEYFMKHARTRDILKLWEEFFNYFRDEILINKERGYIYIRRFLEYTNDKIAKEDYPQLERIITANLAEKGEDIMKTAAQAFREEAIAEGIQSGIQIGEARGRTEEKLEIAKKLLLKNRNVEEIVELTGLSASEVEKLKI